jgi:acetyl-CoA carboxylase carboxyl transferase alpha subunit
MDILKRFDIINNELVEQRNMSAWERIKRARAATRPHSLDYVAKIFEDFFELHGDRYFSDDPAIVSGIAMLYDIPVTIVAQQKGRLLEEKMQRNSGMPHPEGYRKALRLIKQAEKFNRPVICFVDTPGAYPGVGAEERGQARAIADNLFELSGVKTPIVTVVVGEGGSGGALALSVCDKLYMMENSIYSVISPEGCASILWKDASRASEAAENLKLTAKSLKEFGLIDEVIKEPDGFSRDYMDSVCGLLKEKLYHTIKKLMKYSDKKLVQRRQERYLDMGRGWVEWIESK